MTDVTGTVETATSAAAPVSTVVEPTVSSATGAVANATQTVYETTQAASSTVDQTIATAEGAVGPVVSSPTSTIEQAAPAVDWAASGSFTPPAPTQSTAPPSAGSDAGAPGSANVPAPASEAVVASTRVDSGRAGPPPTSNRSPPSPALHVTGARTAGEMGFATVKQAATPHDLAAARRPRWRRYRTRRRRSRRFWAAQARARRSSTPPSSEQCCSRLSVDLGRGYASAPRSSAHLTSSSSSSAPASARRAGRSGLPTPETRFEKGRDHEAETSVVREGSVSGRSSAARRVPLTLLTEDAPKRPKVTPRELEVLGLVAEGLSTREIARRLWVTEETVKTHVRRLHDRLGARTRAHAVAIAFRNGILRP